VRRRWFWAWEFQVGEGYVVECAYLGFFYLIRWEGGRWKWGGWNLD
jgi:hypothetical protein